MTHFLLRLTKCCDWQPYDKQVSVADRYLLLGGQVSIAWRTGIYCLAAGIYCLTDRYLLLGGRYLLLDGQVSTAWWQVSVAWQTGIYCLVAGICCLADRYLLLGGRCLLLGGRYLLFGRCIYLQVTNHNY